ncbi:MAG: ATP-dependent DNA helicase RecG [Candidatus Woesebacteria bacterium]
MSLSVDSPIALLPGVGPAREAQLQELGIETIKDLLFDAPFRYETVEREVLIANLQIDTTVCIKATVASKFPIRTPRFKSMLKAKVTDSSGSLDVTWFNNPFILNTLKIGEEYYFTGKVGLFGKKPALTNPTIEKQIPEFGSLVPVYHESADINSRYLRKLIRFAYENVDLSDTSLMKTIYTKHGLISLKNALESLHQIKADCVDLKIAKERLAFDELFYLIKEVTEQKKAHQQSASIGKLTATNTDINAFFSLLPYAPTSSQRETIAAISLDLVQPHPMFRLVQGEVGSGKTTVAAFALFISARQGKKGILICPTNILARQHFDTLTTLFGKRISIGLYTGKEKETDADILVGTHALFALKGIHPSVVIIDEEHRFGVKQRETFFKLKKKPHFLSMTATPIPRTVALTALSDRDVSYIVSHKDNSNIKTWVTPNSKRAGAYEWIKKTLQTSGHQALIVCPFIEESLIETLSTVKSAKKEYESLQKIFSTFKLDLLHGKLKPEAKEKMFTKMMTGKTDILVTTPVVEVGVDIPKASIIVIEGAERYGLAQLHQLRGRVGRRGQEAFCLLFTSESANERTSSRLEFFAKSYDGNALAEYDLKHRGSGELTGIAQHGFDALKFASWSDLKLIEICKKEVEAIANLK